MRKSCESRLHVNKQELEVIASLSSDKSRFVVRIPKSEADKINVGQFCSDLLGKESWSANGGLGILISPHGFVQLEFKHQPNLSIATEMARVRSLIMSLTW